MDCSVCMGEKASHESQEEKKHTIVLSDTDNDLKSVKYALWMTGLCNKEGEWRSGIGPFRILHTGDWLNKRNPDPEVVRFFRHLKTSAPASCSVVMLVGNHEVEILQRMDSGKPTRLNEKHVNFIKQQDVVYVAGKTLYIHGYPTLKLLLLLTQIMDENMCLNMFNHRFRKAFHEGRYALFKEREGLAIIGDVRRVKNYYQRCEKDGQTRGEKVRDLLKGLNIQTVIHGHRPNVLIQLDYEFKKEISDIRIINNDNKSKLTGLGALAVDPKGKVRFINLKAMYWLGGEKAFRKKIRRILGTA